MADSLILVIQSIIAGQAAAEFRPALKNSLTFAAYAGMLTGALFWVSAPTLRKVIAVNAIMQGFSADIIGRRFAFNFSLFGCSIFAIVAGASPNWYVLATFVSLAAFCAGGNLVLDTTVFLEYLPSSKQYLVTTVSPSREI